MVCSTVIGGLVIKHKVDKAKNNAKQVLNFFTNPKKIAATFVTAKLTNAKKEVLNYYKLLRNSLREVILVS